MKVPRPTSLTVIAWLLIVSCVLTVASFAMAHGVLVRSSTIAEAEQQVDWRSGYLSFTDAPLRDAVAEFNRFNTRPLVLADAQLGELRIGGRFSWRNTEGFARLLEHSYPIRAESRAGQMILHAR